MDMAVRSRCSLALLLFTTFSSFLRSAIAQDYETPRSREDHNDEAWFHFKTRPDIQAPKFNIRIYDKDAISPGYWFFAPYEDLDRLERGKPWVGPYIYDNNGELVWSGIPAFDRFKVWDFRAAEFDGETMLTGISHRDNAGIVLNENYDFIRAISWSRTWGGSNMHEFNVLQNGSRVLVFTKHDDQELSKEQSSVVGLDHTCKAMVQGIKELDISTEPPKTLFEWSGADHIGLDESTVEDKTIEEMCNDDWDIHHFNSLDKFPNGDYLLSSRHTDTIFRISHVDGSIVWRFGGKKSDYTLPEDLAFSRQHHARLLDHNATHTIMSFFDNARGTDNRNHPTYDYSRALVAALNDVEKTAEVIWSADHPNKEYSKARGSHQVLSDGNHFVGWSDRIRLTEHDSHGKLLLHANTYHNIGTYRSYKFPWVGRPRSPPNVYSAAFASGTNRLTTMAYVSWNGATEVARWRLYETDASGNEVQRLNTTDRRGFETDIMHDGHAKYVVVEALDSTGKAIGKSEVVQTLAPVEDYAVNQTKIVYIDGTWKSQAISVAQSPMSGFAAGFTACVVMFVILRCIRRPNGRSWFRAKDSEYEFVHQKEHEGLLGSDGQEMDNLSDEGVDVREKIT